MLKITNTKRPLPPRILLYGPGGVGKTTLAATIPGVLVVPVEEGADALEVARTDRPQTWADYLAILDAIAADRQGFRTLAIDSVTALQELCFRAVCDEAQVKSIESIGYGKGYVRAAELWRLMLDRLTVIRGQMVILLIGHATARKHEDPRLPAYDRLSPRLWVNGGGQGILPMTFEWCDVVACAAYQVAVVEHDGKRAKGIGDGERTMYLQERPAYLAKNRYGLPPEMPFAWEPLISGIRAALASSTPQAAKAA